MALLLKHDPGPCPVDDCPHTTCTSPDYQPGVALAAVQLPARDGVQPRRRFTMPIGGVPGAITTATYRRTKGKA